MSQSLLLVPSAQNVVAESCKTHWPFNTDLVLEGRRVDSLQAWLRAWACIRRESYVLVQSIAFVFTLFFLSVPSLPVWVYQTFVLHARHGCNVTIPKLFVTDHIKSGLVDFVVRQGTASYPGSWRLHVHRDSLPDRHPYRCSILLTPRQRVAQRTTLAMGTICIRLSCCRSLTCIFSPLSRSFPAFRHAPLFFRASGFPPEVAAQTPTVLLFQMLLTPMEVLVGITMKAVSCKLEYEVNRFARDLQWGPSLACVENLCFTRYQFALHADGEAPVLEGYKAVAAFAAGETKETRTEAIDDAVRAAANQADEDVRRFQADYNLPYSIAMWNNKFARRLLFLNKKYRRDTKQALSDDAQHLHLLYKDEERNQGPLQHLDRLVRHAIRHCNDACDLYEERARLRESHPPSAMFGPARRHAAVDRPLGRIARAVEKLRENEEIIQVSYAEWKDCFIAICTTEHLSCLQDALHDRKPHVELFKYFTAPLFMQLFSLAAQRDAAVAKLDFTADIQTAMWYNMLGDQVSIGRLAQGLVDQERLEDEIKRTEEEQTMLFNALEDAFRRVKVTPRTLPTADGSEISVERLRATVCEYEKLMARCNNTLQMGQRVLKELLEVADVV
ncbi:hypothetical protein C8Q76DRAFT_792436 [Earliella scabrosa]|nr:hypothetical protein C8Q76DRAFT_792436 [Earliella scabrosa]